ncbi:MAG: hypothetical protein ACOH2J_01620 [Allorhizobium sp.]
MNLKFVIVAAGACALFVASDAAAQKNCEAVEHFRSSETVEQLAVRCGTSVAALLKANRADTADALRGREAIAVPQDNAGDDWLGSARNAVVDAGRRINDAATAAGRSVSDYLKDQPDLNREVVSFGEKLGLPGVESTPSTGPRLDVAANDSATLDIAASGLPGDKDVVFGWLDDGEVKPLKTFRTDERGRLKTSLVRPATIPDGTRVMFVIETADKTLRLAADSIGQN